MVIILLMLLISLAIFSLFVATGTFIVKKIYLSNQTKRSATNRNVTDNAFKGNAKDGVKWYPTGWTYNEKTGMRDPPDYVQKESKKRWAWDAEKQIWIDIEKETRLEKYRKYHEGRPPTFEEWKAAREVEQNKDESTT